MKKDVGQGEASAGVGYSTLGEDARAEALEACREITDSIHEGLDVTAEIGTVRAQNLGETVLVWGGDRLEAFAVCYCGAGTEAGADNCYVKFAAVRPGAEAGAGFTRLLEACEALARTRGLHKIEAGVNLGRSQAYREMLRFGFRTQAQGVAMHRHDLPGYNRAEVYVVDDWR